MVELNGKKFYGDFRFGKPYIDSKGNYVFPGNIYGDTILMPCQLLNCAESGINGI